MPSSNRNSWFTPYVRRGKWATILDKNHGKTVHNTTTEMQTEKKQTEKQTNRKRDKYAERQNQGKEGGGGEETEGERKHPVKEDDIITEEKNVQIFYRNKILQKWCLF